MTFQKRKPPTPPTTRKTTRNPNAETTTPPITISTPRMRQHQNQETSPTSSPATSSISPAPRRDSSPSSSSAHKFTSQNILAPTNKPINKSRNRHFRAKPPRYSLILPITITITNLTRHPPHEANSAASSAHCKMQYFFRTWEIRNMRDGCTALL